VYAFLHCFIDIVAGNPDGNTRPMHFWIIADIPDAMRINVNRAKLARSPFRNSAGIFPVPSTSRRRKKITRYM
jgi:hypothetical protein